MSDFNETKNYRETENNIKLLAFAKKYKKPLIICLAVIGIIVSILFVKRFFIKTSAPVEKEIELVNTAYIKEIIELSELSTFEVIYDGVSVKHNDKKPDKIDYYVSYKSNIQLGIDLSKVTISSNEETKTITITVPKIKINNISVDITSMDFIFKNNKANNESVSDEAYKLCIDDVSRESEIQQEIFDLAQDNAKNTIEALTTPILSQMDDTYTLVIEEEK